MDDDEEDYTYFGTPLPEIEDEAVLKKKAAKELQVRDEKGRQRFHGAFTGGFSAGYFNTVGTKEGWAPSTFISSRDKISERVQQNPEDFMDDEDFGEFGIATRKIHTTSNFQDPSNSSSGKRKFVDLDSVIPGEAPLKDIVQPVRESIGIIILNKLGWRFGQGIGPRVKKHTGAKVYGCSLFPDTVANEEDDDPMLTAFTFAPKDTEGISFKPKDNCFGLGYTGLSKQSVLHVPADPFAPTKTRSWLAKDKKKIAISGQAFGVGAFEDDDEDIYGKDDMSQYDFSSFMPETPEDKKKGGTSSKTGNFQDVLEGFQLASQPSLVKKHYPPPILPPNFRPIHLKFALSKQADVKVSQSRHSLSASDRSLILGEKTFQKSMKTVPVTIVEEKIPNLTTETTVSSSSRTLNFRPFPNDLAKQQRYEEYLKLKNTGDILKLVQPSSMTEWEKQQEIEEFAKAAVLFKPLSSALSSRFESRSHLSVEQEVMSALEKMKKKEEIVVPVKRNVIGTKNRIVQEWHPVSLLCKRMNVPNPYPDSSSSETQSVVKSKSVFAHLSFTNERTSSSSKTEEVFETPLDTSSISQKGQDSSSLEKNTNDLPLENKRPPIDFFKDIFENSSSDEDDNTTKEKDENDKQLDSGKEVPSQNNLDSKIQSNINSPQISHNLEKSPLIDSKYPSEPVNKKKVGFGVFANLDLDALNQRRPAEKPLQQNALETKSEITEIDLASESSNNVNSVTSKEISKKDDLYGPELPPNFLNSSVPTSNSTRISSKKHSKHKSKHKRHKHKKKKKKKSSKRDSSSSDSSSELDDIPPSLIIEKMKKLQKVKM